MSMAPTDEPVMVGLMKKEDEVMVVFRVKSNPIEAC